MSALDRTQTSRPFFAGVGSRQGTQPPTDATESLSAAGFGVSRLKTAATAIVAANRLQNAQSSTDLVADESAGQLHSVPKDFKPFGGRARVLSREAQAALASRRNQGGLLRTHSMGAHK